MGKIMISVTKTATTVCPDLRQRLCAARNESSAATMGETKRIYNRHIITNARITAPARKKPL
jgi:hypothetical protein